MVGGMITAPLLSMFVIPAVHLLLRRRRVAPSTRPAHPRLGDQTA
jgi:Cu(I)/Ag(I) efflux system membrane protein CusA/SilA